MTQIQAIQDALRRRQAYRDVFLADTQSSQLVLRDLMRVAFPKNSLLVPGKPDVTADNVGAHSFAVGILRMLYRSDKDLHDQIKSLYEQENQT